MEERKKIEVCHVTSAHNRYDVRIFLKECVSLAKNNYKVNLIVNDNLPSEVINGVHIHSTSFKPINMFQRIISSKKFIRKAMELIDAEIYHFHDPDLLSDAIWIKNKGKRVVFDFHEDVGKLFLNRSWVPASLKHLISKVYTSYESHCVKQFDALISVTPQIINRLIENNKNTIMVTNYPILSKNNEISTAKLINNTQLCFAGGISKQWSHDVILKSIENIDNVQYALAGNYSEEYMNELKLIPGWEKVRFLGRVSFEAVQQIYAHSSIGLAILSNETQVGKEGTYGNTKIFEFMEAGLPIICSDNRIWREIIEKYNCGLTVNPESTEEVREAIEYLITNEHVASEMGKNGRKAVESEYNWLSQEEKLIELYDRLTT